MTTNTSTNRGEFNPTPDDKPYSVTLWGSNPDTTDNDDCWSGVARRPARHPAGHDGAPAVSHPPANWGPGHSAYVDLAAQRARDAKIAELAARLRAELANDHDPGDEDRS